MDTEDILVVHKINALAFLLDFEELGVSAVRVVFFLDLLRLGSGKVDFVAVIVVFVGDGFVSFALASFGGGGGRGWGLRLEGLGCCFGGGRLAAAVGGGGGVEVAFDALELLTELGVSLVEMVG